MKLVVGLLAGILLLSTNASATSSGSSLSQEVHGLPAQLADLKVEKEDVAKTLQTEKRALYVDRVGLFSLRQPNNLLQATLEIEHFSAGTPSASADFQLSVANHLGSTAPIVVRVAGRPVYVTTSKGLVLAIWFNGDYMLALAVRSTYAQPKELLRDAMAINP